MDFQLLHNMCPILISVFKRIDSIVNSDMLEYMDLREIRITSI